MASVGNLANEIVRELQRYANVVSEDVDTAAEEVANDLVDELRNISPKKTGSYRKGWRIKNVRGKRIVHNKTDYQLTHLLEKGHVKRGGGRVPAKVHIAPAEQKAVDEFLTKVEQAVRP
ncbi:HK97 gp10 family phage protein [Neobacillus sp. WH10]|uniref:HK97 gp10 family phage protein n=1 Tax=Neobacillus sp. WH10 TaxID=3047873 RepID=UPI0024C10F21|nr:HK97 gp10 family phage protein [Neobacillus sp. WH10]WHY76228.1 HK97 gp10 family phage protein [Neobacillus sp. WH10]